VENATALSVNDGVLPDDALYTDVYHNTPNQRIRGVTVDRTVAPRFQTTAELLKAAKA
jgi:hypothetical protein